jgi:hypothetical protein
MNQEILELAVDLRRQHKPFVMTTVVWRRVPLRGKKEAQRSSRQTVRFMVGSAEPVQPQRFSVK